MPLTLEIVTAERLVFSEDNIDMVVAPSVDGEVGILPHHAPLLTVLQIGEIRVKRGADEQSIVVSGGFLEVLNDKITVLADVAERSEEVDVAAAEQARARAQDAIANKGAGDLEAAYASMRLASLRLRVGSRGRRRRREEG